jgi:hypothetical protein
MFVLIPTEAWKDQADIFIFFSWPQHNNVWQRDTNTWPRDNQAVEYRKQMEC